MKSELTRRARRIAALGLLGALLAIAWWGVVEPIVDYMDTAAVDRGISLRALKRNHALLRQRAAIQAARASIEQSPLWRNFYRGPRADSATLQMETDLREILKDSGNPTSMIAQPAVIRGSVTRIAVRVTLLLRIDQLADALDRIQKQPRQLQVESLTVQAPDLQSAQANPALSVQAEITAMMIDPESQRM